MCGPQKGQSFNLSETQIFSVDVIQSKLRTFETGSQQSELNARCGRPLIEAHWMRIQCLV